MSYHPPQVLDQAAFGELLTASLTPVIAWRFDYSINPLLYTTTGCANGGTVTVDASRAKLSTSANVAGVAQIRTRRTLRYLPGMGGLARFTSVYATAKADTQQIQGIGDDVDGFFFGYNGTSFGIMRRRNSSDNWVPSASWNGSALGETLVQTYGNIYQIRYQWLGYGVVRFYIYDKTVRSFVLVHTIEYPNTTALTSILSPTLPLFAEVKNTGNNTDMVMYSPSALGAMEGMSSGDFNPLIVHRGVAAAATFADTNNNHLISFQNKSSAYTGPVVNRVLVRITAITMSRENNATKGVTFRVYQAATTAGARTYADVVTADSPVATSATTTTVTGGTLLYTGTMPAGAGPFPIDLNHHGIEMAPGDVITIAVQDSAVTSTDVSVSITWEEPF